VKAGHELKKNEGEEGELLNLNIKADTFVIESNIHFPTDLNLLRDSGRKSLATVALLLSFCFVSGWRKHWVWYRKMRKYYRRCANIHRKKGKNYQERLKKATKEYLEVSQEISDRIKGSLTEWIVKATSDVLVASLLESLVYYHEMLEKHIDLVDRRILKGEKIPHEEKVFSIFEPEVEWLQKGKNGKMVELGHNTLIATDQFHFIVDHEVVIKQSDKALAVPLAERLEEKFTTEQGYFLESLSFDRGFFSALAKKAVETKFHQAVMPKAGKKNLKQEMEESQKTFVLLRNKHSAVEANINELEHSGANKVRDKGLKGFKKYVAWSVLSYNLKRLGKIVLTQELLPTIVKGGRQQKQAA
ncbi:MAG: ISNCY family transposase, partial [Candidatus Brocadiaceae bacterium]|nr:ISNCY family transposase [Candidatus Brocadiaceae bacterium]